MGFMIHFPPGALFKVVSFAQLFESSGVNEIELMKLPSWEWMVILVLVMFIVWLMILFQVGSYDPQQYDLGSHSHQANTQTDHPGNGDRSH
jgi:hypothetical protein